ncbi:MAG: HAD family phosphatase [Parcubacteria group bacterium]|nr:HAD family phosphatase [Parcubacteria group bacterium]
MIKLIIFDVGGVITFTDWIKLYSNVAKILGIDPTIIIDYHRDNLGALLVNKLTFDDFVEFLKKHVQALTVENVKQIWISEALKLVRVDKELLNYIDRLRINYKLFILTNASESRMYLDVALDIYQHFDHVFISCMEHLMKPEEAFYQRALAFANTKPEEALFIDDNEKNVMAGQKLGIRGIVYKDINLLKKELLKIGINKF